MAIHTRRDALLKSVKALPAAAGTAVSTAIDLGNAIPGAVGDMIEVEISVPATPALVEAKTITITLHDSADNSSFSAIAGLDTIVITGAGSAAGGAAVTRVVRVPSICRRYIATSAVVLTGGGDNTGVSTTLSVLS